MLVSSFLILKVWRTWFYENQAPYYEKNHLFDVIFFETWLSTSYPSSCPIVIQNHSMCCRWILGCPFCSSVFSYAFRIFFNTFRIILLTFNIDL